MGTAMKFEEFSKGQVFVTASRTVTLEEITEYARRYDNQPMHTDGAVAAGGPFGGIIASGFMTIAVAWQLWLDLGHQANDGRGGIGMDNVRWRRPLLPDTTVQATVTIADHRLSSKGRGIMRWEFVLRDGPGNDLLTFETTAVWARRGEP